MERVIKFEDKLAELKKKFQTISGDWNGEDESFQSGGIPYTEEHARQAQDIVDLIGNIENEEKDYERIGKEIAEDRKKLNDLVEGFDF